MAVPAADSVESGSRSSATSRTFRQCTEEDRQAAGHGVDQPARRVAYGSESARVFRRLQYLSVVAWIGTEMEFPLSQVVASGDAFEHRPSECGHCVQDFLADLDLRDLPGEAAGFELGADHALLTADLRFYPAALVVPCGRLPGHAAVAADLGNGDPPPGRAVLWPDGPGRCRPCPTRW